jgi:hypothetical protein
MKKSLFPVAPISLLILGISGLLLTGCRTAKPLYSHDATVDFAAVRSYAWATETIPPQVANIVDFDYVDPRIRKGVDEELTAKGLTRAAVSSADLLLSYRLVLTGDVSPQDLSGQMTRSPAGGSSRFIWAWDRYDLVGDEYVKGVLQVGMVSRESGNLVWWGSISTPVAIYEDMQRERGKLRRLIGKLMTPYPGP